MAGILDQRIGSSLLDMNRREGERQSFTGTRSKPGSSLREWFFSQNPILDPDVPVGMSASPMPYLTDVGEFINRFKVPGTDVGIFEGAGDLIEKVGRGETRSPADYVFGGMDLTGLGAVGAMKHCIKGQCFRNTVMTAGDLEKPIFEAQRKAGVKGKLPDTGIEVIHGKVTNANGQRLDHSWIEMPDGRVIDPTTDAVMSKERYYAVTDAKVAKRYSTEQATLKSIKEGNYGPWMEAFNPKTTDMPYYDDLIESLDDPFKKNYFREQKGIESRMVDITPDEYLGAVDAGFTHGVDSGIDAAKVSRYADKIRDGETFPALTLDYARGKKLSQEGRHRALAAKKAGVDRVPVLVVTPTPEEAAFLGAVVPKLGF